MRWCVYDGEHEGRWLFDNVIVQHDSPEAMKFGRRKFKDIATACGITSPITDVEVLVGKRAALVVGIEKDTSGQYPDKNRIRRVLALRRLSRRVRTGRQRACHSTTKSRRSDYSTRTAPGWRPQGAHAGFLTVDL